MAEKNRYHLNDSRFSVNAALDLFVLRQSYEGVHPASPNQQKHSKPSSK